MICCLYLRSIGILNRHGLHGNGPVKVGRDLLLLVSRHHVLNLVHHALFDSGSLSRNRLCECLSRMIVSSFSVPKVKSCHFLFSTLKKTLTKAKTRKRRKRNWFEASERMWVLSAVWFSWPNSSCPSPWVLSSGWSAPPQPS